MPDQLTTTLDSLKSFWNQLLHFLPQLLVAFLLLIVGWLVAKLLRKGLIKLLRMIHVDVAAEKAGRFHLPLNNNPSGLDSLLDKLR